MPYETTWEKQGVYQRFSGQLTKGDREQAHREIFNDQRFDRIKYRVIDSLDIEEYQLEKEDAVDAAAFNIGARRTNPNILMAFVVTNTDHRDNILHFMKTLESHGTWKVRLFDDVESARQWISETLKH